MVMSTYLAFPAVLFVYIVEPVRDQAWSGVWSW